MPKMKKKKSTWKVVLIALVLLLIVLVAGGFYYIQSNLQPVGNGEHQTEFEIAEGESFDSVLANLESEGLIRSDFAASLYARIGNHNQYYAGLYDLNDGMSTPQILAYIGDDANVKSDAVVLTIPEGTWAKEIAASISDLFPQYSVEDILNTWNDSDYINELASSYSFLDANVLNNDQYKVKLEGYLFPETYYLDKDSDIDTITRTLLNQFQNIYQSHQSEFANSSYSVHELVTLASIVQFESGSISDMKQIAGVFYNRLDQSMNLESSVTVCYALYDDFDDPQDCETQTDVDSPYNTYMNAGLPIGPILNPGEQAIVAVLEPASSNYLYFAADIHGDGTVYYSETYEEHLKICEELGLILN